MNGHSTGVSQAISWASFSEIICSSREWTSTARPPGERIRHF
jgi:hypothetical protein